MKNMENLKEENRKIRKLQIMVHFTTQLLYQKSELNLLEGLLHIQNVRKFALGLFPGKGEVFDLIYRTRLLRVLEERGLFFPNSN